MAGIKSHPQRKKHPLIVTLSKWVIDWLKEQPQSRGSLLEAALIAQHKLTRPILEENEKGEENV